MPSGSEQQKAPSRALRSAGEQVALLAELQQAHREMVEQDLVRRTEGPQRVSEAVRRLSRQGSPGGVLELSAMELGESSQFEGVLVSRLSEDTLTPVAHWVGDAAGVGEIDSLRGTELQARYPYVEAEVIRRQRGELVSGEAAQRRGMTALMSAFGWEAYVVVPIRLEGTVVGLVHAGRVGSSAPPDEIDRDCAALYADGLGRAYERAVLREKLQWQRQHLRLAARWIDGQTLALTAEGSLEGDEVAESGSELEEMLTPRELQTIDLIARGMSNRQIAETLMIGEGTAKYHVKNVLRKLGVRSRAEAVSAYMRLRGGS